MKAPFKAALLATFVIVTLFSKQAIAASSYTFPAFDVGTLTGGGTAFTKSLNVSNLPPSEYFFVRITATHTSAAPTNDAWSSTMDMELNDGGTNVYWPADTATLGAMSQPGTSHLIWTGFLAPNTYQGGNNLTIKFVDTYTDSSGPYYSSVSNVVVTIYPAPTPAKTFPAFDVETITGGGAAVTKPLDVSGLTNSEYLFARVSADYNSTNAISSSLEMELNDGGTNVYWPTNTASSGARFQAGASHLVWSGLLTQNSYQGGDNLTIKFVDPFDDANGPYNSSLSNVVAMIYPAPTPAKTFPAFDVGTLTGGGAAFTKSLDVSNLPPSEYLFVRITATHTSAAPPNDAWSSTMDMELNDGGTNVYWPADTATLGTMGQPGTSHLIWSGLLAQNTYQGGNNLTIKFFDTFDDGLGPYYSTISNVVVTIYPAVSASTTAPQLMILRSGSNVILTWPDSFTGFTLQSTTNLSSNTSWKPVSPMPVVISGQNTVTNHITEKQLFYRLSQ